MYRLSAELANVSLCHELIASLLPAVSNSFRSANRAHSFSTCLGIGSVASFIFNHRLVSNRTGTEQAVYWFFSSSCPCPNSMEFEVLSRVCVLSLAPLIINQEELALRWIYKFICRKWGVCEISVIFDSSSSIGFYKVEGPSAVVVLVVKARGILMGPVAQKHWGLDADAIKSRVNFSYFHWNSSSQLYWLHQLAPLIFAVVAFLIQQINFLKN